MLSIKCKEIILIDPEISVELSYVINVGPTVKYVYMVVAKKDSSKIVVKDGLTKDEAIKLLDKIWSKMISNISYENMLFDVNNLGV